MDKAEIAFEDSCIVAGKPLYHSGFSEEDGYDAMQTILEVHPDASAVFASSDVQAIGAMLALNEAGLRMPSDIALVGYDDIKTSRFVGLSSVHQSMQEIGYAATKKLCERLEGPTSDGPEQVVIEPILKIRASSDLKRII